VRYVTAKHPRARTDDFGDLRDGSKEPEHPAAITLWFLRSPSEIREVRIGSKWEELNVGKSSPLLRGERTLPRRAQERL
jgi:hypothetical protein